MSQRERYRRRLARETNAILYAGVPAALARPHLPPDVQHQLTEAPCHCCHTPVVAHTQALLLMQHAAQKNGQELLIVCPGCTGHACGNADAVELSLIDPELKARLQQWETEAN